MNINLELFKNFYLFASSYLLADIEIESIRGLEHSVLKRKGIRHIIFDLDGTLVSENLNVLHRSITKDFKKLRNQFSCCILSNNAGNELNDQGDLRAKQIEKLLKVGVIRTPYLKPNSRAYDCALEHMKALPSETVLITDKRYDVAGGKRKGMFTVLTKPIDINAEPLSGKIERFIENSSAKILRKFRKIK